MNPIIWIVGGNWVLGLTNSQLMYAFAGNTLEEQFANVQNFARALSVSENDWEEVEDAIYDWTTAPDNVGSYARLFFQNRQNLLYADSADPAVYSADDGDLLAVIEDAGEALLDMVA